MQVTHIRIIGYGMRSFNVIFNDIYFARVKPAKETFCVPGSNGQMEFNIEIIISVSEPSTVKKCVP